MGFGLMEPLEKMSAMWCARMPERLGVNASHVGGDWVGKYRCEQSPPVLVEDIEVLRGGFIGAMRRRKSCRF